MRRSYDEVCWHAKWPESLRKAVYHLYISHTRVAIDDGSSRPEIGYIGMTGTGYPILIYNSRSNGGPTVSSKVNQVRSTKKNGQIYWDFERDEPILWVMSQ